MLDGIFTRVGIFPREIDVNVTVAVASRAHDERVVASGAFELLSSDPEDTEINSACTSFDKVRTAAAYASLVTA